MKTKVLFIMPAMFIGGAERSLLGLLDSFDYSNYDVSLFLYRHTGEFLNYIPKQVKIIDPMDAYATFDVPIKSLLKSKMFLYGIARIIGKICCKVKAKKVHLGVWASMQYISKSLLPLLPKIPGEYDVAISFLGIPDVLLYKTVANKKIAWNHTDYTILGPDQKYDRKIYNRIDNIVSVSETCTNQFLKVYPELKDKAVTIENLIGYSLILQQSEEPVMDFFPDKDEITLLSVGRFSDAKNFDNIPDICRRLRQKGLPIRWYIIGYGGEEDLICQRIREMKMEEYVIILGKKINPYPYVKMCDYYVQPSRYEGKCVSVIEAQILNKPVIITNYATSNKQLRNGVDGIIVPMDNEECVEKMAKILQDSELKQDLIANTYTYDYSNKTELEKLYRLF